METNRAESPTFFNVLNVLIVLQRSTGGTPGDGVGVPVGEVGMLRLAHTQGVKFWMMAGAEIAWPDGSVMVPPGAIGAAVIEYGGSEPGWIVEWDHFGICAVTGAEEGRVWHRLTGSPATLRLQ